MSFLFSLEVKRGTENAQWHAQSLKYSHPNGPFWSTSQSQWPGPQAAEMIGVFRWTLLRHRQQPRSFPTSLTPSLAVLSLVLLFLHGHWKPCAPLTLSQKECHPHHGWAPCNSHPASNYWTLIISCFQGLSHRMMLKVDIKVLLFNNKIWRAAFLFSGPTTAI